MELKNILLFTVSLITAYLSLFLIRGKKDYSSIVFAVFMLFVGMWAFGVSYFYLADNVRTAELYAKFYYISAAAIPTFFLLFSFSFPKKSSILRNIEIISGFILVGLSACIAFYPHFIIQTISLGDPKSVVLDKASYTIYFVYFILILATAYIRLIYAYKKESDPEVKVQSKILILGTIFPYIGGMIFNLILPIFTYAHVWIGPLFGMVVVLVVLYAVYKHKLFDTKVLTAELFTFALWIFILIRVLIAENAKEQMINIGLLSLTVPIGFFLIRSVKKEVETREKLQRLATDLESANSHLQELDQQKSEFVSLASHQLRGPLTAVKGYTSMLKDGDFGDLNPEAKDAVEKIFNQKLHLN